MRVTAENPARIFGLGAKGRLEPGCDADVVLVDLDSDRVDDDTTWGSRPGRYNIWEGWTMRGWPALTMSRGEILMERGELRAEGGPGQSFAPPRTHGHHHAQAPPSREARAWDENVAGERGRAPMNARAVARSAHGLGYGFVFVAIERIIHPTQQRHSIGPFLSETASLSVLVAGGTSGGAVDEAL